MASLKFATATILLLLIMVVHGMNSIRLSHVSLFPFVEAIRGLSFRLSVRNFENLRYFNYIMSSGDCQRCVPSKMEIQQTNTGKKVGTLDTVFRVTVTNWCRCAVKNVYLQAPNGFSSSTPVAPKLFRRAGAGYLLADGHKIPRTKSVTFEYAWDHYFKMTPERVQAEC